MPVSSFTTPTVAGTHQLTPPVQPGQSIRITGFTLSASGDTGPAGLSSIAQIAANISTPLAIPCRLGTTIPASWLGDISLPPGCAMAWTQANAVAVYGAVNYSIDGPDLRGPNAAWTPLSVPGLGGLLSSANSQWSDNRVTAAAALDARVYKWANSLRTLDGIAADTTTARLYRTAEGGVRGDGVAAGFKAFQCPIHGDFTVLTKVRRTAIGAGGFWGPGWSAAARFRHDGAGAFNYFDDAIGGIEIPVITGTVANTWYTLAMKRENGTVSVRGSGGNWISYPGNAGGALPFVQFSPSGDVMPSTLQILEAAFVYRGISDAEWTLFNTYWGT